MQRLSGGPSGAERASDDYESRYLSTIRRDLDYVELLGVEVLPETSDHSLSIAYIPLTIANLAEVDSEDNGPEDFEALLNGTLLTNNRLLIIGEAGSGKSTLMRWAAVSASQQLQTAALDGDLFHPASGPDFTRLRDDGFRVLPICFDPTHMTFGEVLRRVGSLSVQQDLLARYVFSSKHEVQISALGMELFSVDAGNDAALDSFYPVLGEDGKLVGVLRDGRFHASWRRRVPFLVRLRHCEKGELPSPEDFPSMVSKALGTPPANWVSSILQAKRAMILLDGVDEIPECQSGCRRAAAIKSLMKTYEGNLFVVTSRPTALAQGWLADLGFEQARINRCRSPTVIASSKSGMKRWPQIARSRRFALEGRRTRQHLESQASRCSPDPPARHKPAAGCCDLRSPLLAQRISARHESELCEAICRC